MNDWQDVFSNRSSQEAIKACNSKQWEQQDIWKEDSSGRLYLTSRHITVSEHFDAQISETFNWSVKNLQGPTWRSWGRCRCWGPPAWHCRTERSLHTLCCFPAGGHLSLWAPHPIPETMKGEWGGEPMKKKTWTGDQFPTLTQEHLFVCKVSINNMVPNGPIRKVSEISGISSIYNKNNNLISQIFFFLIKSVYKFR